VASGRISEPPKRQALAGEHAVGAVAELLHHAGHEAHLAAAHADVTGRHVGVGADMAEQFGHESLAEAHHLARLLPLGSKSEPPLPPPMGSVVSAFLKVCSKARNFRIDRFTDG
jgi:hypothetical protein